MGLTSDRCALTVRCVSGSSKVKTDSAVVRARRGSAGETLSQHVRGRTGRRHQWSSVLFYVMSDHVQCELAGI